MVDEIGSDFCPGYDTARKETESPFEAHRAD